MGILEAFYTKSDKWEFTIVHGDLMGVNGPKSARFDSVVHWTRKINSWLRYVKIIYSIPFGYLT